MEKPTNLCDSCRTREEFGYIENGEPVMEYRCGNRGNRSLDDICVTTCDMFNPATAEIKEK